MRGGSLALRLSHSALSTASPPIPQAYKWASRYIPTQDRPLLDMSQGVPGIPPPKTVLAGLANAASDPRSCGYCPMTGEPKMRQALAEEMKHVYGADSDIIAEDVALTTGCNMAFVVSIMCLADTGDEVILPVPWYFNHQMSLDMLGIKTVPLQTFSREGFMPSPDQCAALITSKTKAIVLVTPNNPTGAIYTPSLIASFARLAQDHGVALIIDETYRDFITDGPHTVSSRLQRCPGGHGDSASFIYFLSLKATVSPGHRLGAIVAPAEVLDHVKTVLDCVQICPPRSIQLALHPLLPDLRGFIKETASSLVHRHQLFRSLLPESWKIGSQGAYYAFVRHPFAGVSSTDVSERLAVEAGVVTLPARFFTSKTTAGQEVGADEDRWIRFSVANVDDDKVRKVCERLEECPSLFGWDVEKLEGA